MLRRMDLRQRTSRHWDPTVLAIWYGGIRRGARRQAQSDRTREAERRVRLSSNRSKKHAPPAKTLRLATVSTDWCSGEPLGGPPLTYPSGGIK